MRARSTVAPGTGSGRWACLALCLSLGVVPAGRAEEPQGAAPVPAPEGKPAAEPAPQPPRLVCPPCEGTPFEKTHLLPESAPAPSKDKSFLFPVLNIVGVQTGYMLFNRFVLDAPYAYVSLASWKYNLRWSRYEYDNDILFLNQFGHPYQGSFAMASARAYGLSFWESLAYPVLESYLWETFGEVEPPSVNDMITTSFGGIILGEMFHRLYWIARDYNGGPVPFPMRLLATLISPMDGFVGWVSPGRPRDVRRFPPWFGEVTVGVLGLGSVINQIPGSPESRDSPDRNAVTLGLRMTYGHPGDATWEQERPFDYFDISLLVGAGRSGPTLNLLLRGWLAGWTYGAPENVHGIVGFLSGYDFLTPAALQVSTVSVGFGTVLQLRINDQHVLQGAAIASGVPFGAAGELPRGVKNKRNYQYGSGGQALVEGRYIAGQAGEVRASARAYGINGSYVGQGWENTLILTLGMAVRLWGRHALGSEASFGWRGTSYIPDVVDAQALQRFSLYSVFYTVLSDEAFGATRTR